MVETVINADILVFRVIIKATKVLVLTTINDKMIIYLLHTK